MELEHSPRSIAEAGHRGDRQLTTEALAARDPEARRLALGAADRLGILDYNLLTAALKDSGDRVRRRALELAARRSHPEHADEPAAALLTEAVIELLGDDGCAEAAAYALGELGRVTPDIVSRLEQQAANHQDALCRESAVAALGSLGAGRATVLAAADDVATVRRRAIIALANFEGGDVDRAINDALEDRDWQVRQAAEDLLAPPDDR